MIDLVGGYPVALAFIAGAVGFPYLIKQWGTLAWAIGKVPWLARVWEGCEERIRREREEAATRKREREQWKGK